jgi:hypothetical protein
LVKRETVIVESISDRDGQSLKALKTGGIVPGIRLRVRRRDAGDGYAVTVGSSTKVLHISNDAAGAIRIRSPQ